MSHPSLLRVRAARMALRGVMLVPVAANMALPAQSPAAGVPAEARQAAERYLATSGAEEYGKAFFAASRRAVAERIRKYTPQLAARPDSIEAVIAAGLPWQRVHEAAVDALARRFGAQALARATQLNETASGRRISNLRRSVVKELEQSGQPLDSFPARFSMGLRSLYLPRADMDSLNAFLGRPEGKLFTPLFDVWLNSMLAAWSDLERRTPGISGGRVDAAKGTVDFDVDKPAVPLPNNPAPFFPGTLRQANVTGSVQAEFVVTAAGRVDTATFKPLRSSHELFTAAVRTMLPAWRFTPAELLGHHVNQLVVQQFDFALTAPAARKDTTRR